MSDFVLKNGGLRSGEHFIDAFGVRLRVVIDTDSSDADSSRNNPVIILHGFTGSAESMEPVSEALRPRHPVVRLELIGHGGSESPASLDPYLMNACAAQIVEVVRQLGLIRPHLLGYSMGGRAALAAALVKPNQFSSLVLVGATAGIAELSRRRERVAEDRALADRIEARPLAEFVEEWMALPLFSSQASLGSAALSRARAQRMKNLPLGLANSLRGMGAGAQPPLFDQLDQLDAPVLLVAGELDTKFRQIATSLQALLPNARTEIISGVGHAAHLEDPIEFAERAVKFFSEPRLAVAGSLSGPAKSVEPVRSDCV